MVQGVWNVGLGWEGAARCRKSMRYTQVTYDLGRGRNFCPIFGESPYKISGIEETDFPLSTRQ